MGRWRPSWRARPRSAPSAPKRHGRLLQAVCDVRIVRTSDTTGLRRSYTNFMLVHEKHGLLVTRVPRNNPVRGLTSTSAFVGRYATGTVHPGGPSAPVWRS